MKAKGAKVSINPVKPGKGNFVVKTEKKNSLLRQFEQIQLDFVGGVDAHLQMEQASSAKNSLFAEQACSAKSY